MRTVLKTDGMTMTDLKIHEDIVVELRQFDLDDDEHIDKVYIEVDDISRLYEMVKEKMGGNMRTVSDDSKGIVVNVYSNK